MPQFRLICSACDDRIADAEILCPVHWPLVDPPLRDLIELERKLTREALDKRDGFDREWHSVPLEREQLRTSSIVALKLAVLKT